MSSASKTGQIQRQGGDYSHGIRVLVMCEEKLDAAIWKELLRLPGCAVQVCRNLIELLLFLEHEMFHLVMIFEGDNSSAVSQTTANYLAEAHRETAVFFVRRPVDEYPTQRLESLN